MPNFQSFNALSTTGEHALFARTVIGETPEDSNVIFQTTRGANVWLEPADQRALIDWLHRQLGDTAPAAREIPDVIYQPCGAQLDPGRPLNRCVLVAGHDIDAGTDHAGKNGERWAS